MRLGLVGSAAMILAVGLLATGCSPEQEPEPAPAPIVAPSAPAEAPTPSPTPTPELPDCENIVSAETIAVLEVEGFILIKGHERDLRIQNRIEARFFDFGGVDCLWGIAAGGDSMAAFGYSEITPDDAAEVQDWLGQNGYLRAEDGEHLVFTVDPETDVMGHGDIFRFEPGVWYHANHVESIGDIRDSVAALG